MPSFADYLAKDQSHLLLSGAVGSQLYWLGAGGSHITQSNMTPEQATEEAAKRIKQLFERYQRRRPRWRGQGCVPSAPVVATRDEA